MEIGEPSARVHPKRPPLSPGGSTFAGILRGPTGPLADWPFVLRRGGRPLSPSGLGSGRSPNAYREDCWWSGAAGEFRFEELPEGCYSLEIVFPGARLQRCDPHPAALEDGERATTPAPVDHVATLGPTDFADIA